MNQPEFLLVVTIDDVARVGDLIKVCSDSAGYSLAGQYTGGPAEVTFSYKSHGVLRQAYEKLRAEWPDYVTGISEGGDGE